jgi:hypothetical protein
MPLDNGECNGVEGEAIFPSNLQYDEVVVQQQNLQKKKKQNLSKLTSNSLCS